MKKVINYILLLVITPLIVLLGAIVFKDKQYAFVTIAVAVIACVPFFLSFEKKKDNTKEMVVLAIMTAMATVGRMIFAPIPGFKPVTAIIVLTAIYFGGEMGFLTGALSAVISNFYFGQGPWTPFQMFVWGLIGLIAGVIANPLKKSKVLLIIYGIVSGLIFSFLMDIWTVLWWDGSFNLARYGAAIASAAWFTVEYAVSNVIFLLALVIPLGPVIERIKKKYGI